MDPCGRPAYDAKFLHLVWPVSDYAGIREKLMDKYPSSSLPFLSLSSFSSLSLSAYQKGKKKEKERKETNELKLIINNYGKLSLLEPTSIFLDIIQYLKRFLFCWTDLTRNLRFHLKYSFLHIRISVSNMENQCYI